MQLRLLVIHVEKSKIKLDLFMLHKTNSSWTNCGKQKSLKYLQENITGYF